MPSKGLLRRTALAILCVALAAGLPHSVPFTSAEGAASAQAEGSAAIIDNDRLFDMIMEGTDYSEYMARHEG